MPNMDDEDRDLILIAFEHLAHESQLLQIVHHVIFPSIRSLVKIVWQRASRASFPATQSVGEKWTLTAALGYLWYQSNSGTWS